LLILGTKFWQAYGSKHAEKGPIPPERLPEALERIKVVTGGEGDEFDQNVMEAVRRIEMLARKYFPIEPEP
jgi:ribosome maturation protein Sdo1